MGEMIEKGRNLRKFLYFLIPRVILVLLLALGGGVWVTKH